MRPTTFDFYAVLIRKQLMPRLGALTLTKLTPQAIQGAYADMLRNGRCDGKGGLSPRTVRHCHTVLHTALTFAVRWQVIARNPAEAVEPPKVREQEPVPLEDAQLAQALTGAAGTWLEVPVLLSAFTGMRRGEVLAVRWSDIDTEEGIIHVRQTLQRTSDGLRFGTPKTEKGRRRIEIGPELLDRLQRHQKEQARHRFQRLQAEQGWENLDLVVCQEDGSPRTPDNLTQGFLKLTRRAGMDGANFHSLRHTHATHLLMDGEPVNVVQERLGHSAASITMDRYGHVLPGRQKVAAAKSDAQFLRVMGATG